MKTSLQHLPLFWRVLLSTSIAMTLVFALTGWAVQTYAIRESEASLEEEVRTNLRASEAIWTMRVHNLSAMSRIISSMSDVRSAFMTRDEATIRDSAQELWSRVSDEDAIFMVLDPDGRVIATLGGGYTGMLLPEASVRYAAKSFPNQVSGFLRRGKRLVFVVLTPVYVQSGNGQALINILLAGFEVNEKFVSALKRLTLEGEFAFLLDDTVVATTLDRSSAVAIAYHPGSPESLKRVRLKGSDYMTLGSELKGIDGVPVGELLVLRSLAGATHARDELQRNIALIWLCAILGGLAFTSMLARRIVDPVKQLDRAAAEVAKHNYDYRVPVTGADELGRLASTFNAMCDSVRSAREELIRHERIATIGRLSTSIVHDLRNPLAAIYGGAEILMDRDLSPVQLKRLAGSIHSASRRIEGLLQDLVNVSRGKGEAIVETPLSEIVNQAREAAAALPRAQNVSVSVEIPPDVKLPLARMRMQRVFLNLIGNAFEAMPNGGTVRISSLVRQDCVIVIIDDTGKGVSAEVRAGLFQPFVSEGKKNGLGLGLALSRQTVIDHGGDLWWEEKEGPGARFCMRLPLAPAATVLSTA